MTLRPCTDDLISLFAIYPVILLCEGFLAWVCDWNTALVIGLLLLNLLLLLNSLRDALYFARTITLNKEGFTVSLLSYQKTYPWTDLTLTLCDHYGSRFHDSDRPGRGILILPKSHTPAKRLSPMTACRWFHPCKSIFLRFQSSPAPASSGKVMYEGYIVREEEILDFLLSIEVI